MYIYIEEISVVLTNMVGSWTRSVQKHKKNKRKSYLSTIFIFLLFFTIIYLYSKSNKIPEEPIPMPTQLNDRVETSMNRLVDEAGKIGIRVVITADYRSADEQNRLYEQGRTTEGNIVTNAKAGESYHNYGLAIDFALLDIDGTVIWDMNYDGNGNGKKDWNEVVEIAKSLGYEWGGDWKNFKDYPHLQMDFGLSIEDLQRGERPE